MEGGSPGELSGRESESEEASTSSKFRLSQCTPKRVAPKTRKHPRGRRRRLVCWGSGMTIRHLFWPAVASILAIVGALEVRSARGESQTWDEGIHISAGYSYLKFGDYSWNVEHPPLVKMVSALPPVSYTHLRAHETRHDLV